MNTDDIMVGKYKLKNLKKLISSGNKISISTKTYEILIEMFEKEKQDTEEVIAQFVLDREELEDRIEALEKALQDIQTLVNKTDIDNVSFEFLKTINIKINEVFNG